MGLYTFIFDFKGGTYTSQVRAEDLGQSIEKWTKKLKTDRKEIDDLEKEVIHEIETELLGDEATEYPVSLSHLKNVWCRTVNTNEGLGLINIIKTVE